MLNNLKNRKSNDKGFTIIEVLIVLAIAGLILLIVFLAVPALQRSSRNTQRKNDASAVAGAVANFISNNGGTLPKGIKVDPSDPNAVAVTAAAAGTGNLEVAKLGYYTYSSSNTTLVNTATPATPTKDQIIIDTGYQCNTTNTGIGSLSTRSAAILYAIESSSSAVTVQCVEQ
jgi:prepilin-type N-terminal cleavage/methylation domain-containing protein